MGLRVLVTKEVNRLAIDKKSGEDEDSSNNYKGGGGDGINRKNV